MRNRPVIFLARWAGMATIVVMAMSGVAQPTIQFSRPVDQDGADKPKSLPPQKTSRNSPNDFNAPVSLFGDKNPVVSFDVLPGSPAPNPVSQASAAQWRKFLEGKKNWTLMTPEEVLGIPTAEKIMGVAELKDDARLSPEERFLLRQDRLATAGVTNASSLPNTGIWRGDSPAEMLQPADAGRRFAQTFGGSIAGAARNLNSLLNPNPDASADVNRRADSMWAKPFGMPEPLPKATPEQLAGMERFRALMEPSVPEKSPEAARTVFQPLPVALPNPNLQVLPAFNPAGRSFSALESGIAKPIGIAPLPGITGPRVPEKKTASLTQPPPWLQDSTPGFVPVQRQF